MEHHAGIHTEPVMFMFTGRFTLNGFSENHLPKSIRDHAGIEFSTAPFCTSHIAYLIAENILRITGTGTVRGLHLGSLLPLHCQQGTNQIE